LVLSGIKEMRSINGKDISFEDFRIKVSNVEKSTEGITSTAECGTKRFL
jgi:peptidyl-prolyl cis-trans isomerase D